MPDRPNNDIRSAAPLPESYDPRDNTIEVVFCTGARVTRFDWRRDEYWIEDLPLSGMILDDLNEGASVLREHNASLDAVIGSVVPGSARVQTLPDGSQEARARVRLSTAPSDAELVTKIRDGIVRKWSYGYTRNGEPIISRDESTGFDVLTWESHTPFEISPVAVPADPGTGTRSKEEFPMSEQNTPETARQDEAALRAARAEGARAEAQRQTDIRSIAAKLRLSEDDVRSYLTDPECTVDSFRAKAIDLAAERADSTPTHPTHAAVTGGRDEGDVRIAGITAALETRLIPGTALPDSARDFRGASLVDLAGARLALAGVRLAGRTRHEIAEMALRSGNRAGAHTTSDFPYLLAAGVNKTLRAQRDVLPDYLWFERIATRADFPDFKVRSNVSLSGLGVLPEVPEGAEYVSVTMNEGREEYRAVKHGAEFILTLEALINDDLSAFNRQVIQFGRSAVITASAVAASRLTSQTMGDGVALYHADHANLSTSGGAPDVDKLDELDQFLRTQTDGNGEVIGMPGRFLFLPSGVRKVTEQLFSDKYVPTDPTDALTVDIPKENRLYVPSLTGTPYYMGTGDPTAMEFGFLQGEGGAVVTQYAEERSDAVAYHGRFVFGCRILDWRSFSKNPGA